MSEPTMRVALVGAGRMGGALLEGWLDVGIPADHLRVVDPGAGEAISDLCQKKGVALNPTPNAVDRPDIVVLAVKPQALDAAAPAVELLLGPDVMLVSVVAGKTAANLRARFPTCGPVVRAMPNTPAAVGRGITGVASDSELTSEQRAAVDRLLGAVGRVEWLPDEALIDAVTAVSGSGPAYVFYLAECLARAGEKVGLPPDVAARLARATVEGAGELMFRDAHHAPAELRRNVTSPGGTTAAAFAVLSAADGLEPMMERAVGAALRRAGELAG